MAENELRLGDLVDDYCKRCRLLMNHYVVSMLAGEVKKVRCQTCHYEHDFQHGEGAKKKKSELQTLFDQVAASLPQVTSSQKPAKPGRNRKV